jgi:hypothetical protein
MPAADDEQVRKATLFLPDETSRLLPLDRGALTIELDDDQKSSRGGRRDRDPRLR